MTQRQEEVRLCRWYLPHFCLYFDRIHFEGAFLVRRMFHSLHHPVRTLNCFLQSLLSVLRLRDCLICLFLSLR